MNRRTLHPRRSDPVEPCFIHLDIHAKYDRTVERWVAGSRELDVWSSGGDPKEALDRAAQAICLFLNQTEQLGTIWEVLKDAGLQPQAARSPDPEGIFERLLDAVKHEYSFPITFPLPRSNEPLHAE